MKISEELREILQSKAEQIERIEVTYPNGGIASGPIKKLKLNPLKIVITKVDASGKPSGKHRIMFEHTTALSIRFSDGRIQNF
jgi:hypothetical protein